MILLFSELADANQIEVVTRDLTKLFITFSLPILGIFLGLKFKRPEIGEKFRILPFGICIGLFLFGLLGYFGSGGNSNKPSAKVSEYSIQVDFSTQDAKGLTEQGFNEPTLKNFEKWSVEATNIEGEESLSAKSLYANRYGHKLAVVELSSAGLVRITAIFGVQGNNLVRVACYSKNDVSVDYTSGPCDDKLRELFSAEKEAQQ